jgi:TonB family protein
MNRFASLLVLALATSAGAGAAPTANWSGLPVPDDTCTGPQWPRESIARGPQGVLAIGVLVAADGSRLRSEILSSSGDPLLDSSALAYLSGCRFRPALAGGRPVERWLATHYVWNIESGALPKNQKLVRAAAGRGDAAAQYALGYVLAHGKSPSETAEGMRWLLSAANQGHAMAQHQLGDLYSVGLGVGADLQQARAWYARAAAQGNGPARDRLRDLGGAP